MTPQRSIDFVWAALNGDLPAVKAHLQNPALDLDAGYDFNSGHGYGYRAIHSAARNGHIDVVRFLLTEPRMAPHLTINCRCYDPLMAAAEAGYVDVVDLLLSDARVTIDTRHRGTDILHAAVENLRGPVVRRLLADPRFDPSTSCRILTMIAVQGRSLETVQALLADPRTDPGDGDNISIRNAAYYGLTAIVEALLADPRVDPTAGDNTALHEAQNRGHSTVVELLLADPRVAATAGHLRMGGS